MYKISRIVKRGNGDFHQCYRPCRISEVYGQDEITEAIRKGLNEGTLPHSLLFHGVSGSGKTTVARIIAMGLNCKEGPTSEPCCECDSCLRTKRGNSMSVRETNSVDYSGIDFIRKIRDEFDAYPFGDDRKRVYIFDEAHGLSIVAQNSLLKHAEDALDHLHFIFCSTAPGRIIETLRNRCMGFEFKRVRDEYIHEMLMDILIQEGYLPCGVIDDIVKQADGKPRNALHEIQKAIAVGKFKKMPCKFTVEENMKNIQGTFEHIRKVAEAGEIHMTKE